MHVQALPSTALQSPGLKLGHFKSHPKAPPEQAAPAAAADPQQALTMSFQYHLERLTVDRARGAFEYSSFDMKIEYQGTMEGFKKLQEYFTPDKTADRIVSFIKRGFEGTSFGATGDRAGFVEHLMPFVRQGVDEALSLFSAFAETVTGPAEATYDRVDALLKEFAAPQEEEKTVSSSGRRGRAGASPARPTATTVKGSNPSGIA